MAKRANPRAVKANLTYTIEEAADCLGVSIGTVRTWAKNGLPILKAQRPFLITGFALRTFLEKQRQIRKSRWRMMSFIVSNAVGLKRYWARWLIMFQAMEKVGV